MTRYAERLWPPGWLWVAGAIFVLSLALAFFAAAGPLWGLMMLIAPAALLTWGLIASAARVEVCDERLRAGSATIPLSMLGDIEVLDAPKAHAVRGPDSDPAGYHLIRGWIPTGVRVEQADPADPTPYWFIASRHPQALADAIEKSRSS